MRSNPGGPLLQALDALDPGRVHRIDLGPLPLEVVVDLVADALRTSREEATSLGALVHERTAGNPFFVGQFLLSLTEDGLIRFAADTGRWLWDLPAIRERGMTDNVVDLMAGRVGDLPPATQKALRVAAVIGNTFDLGTLAADAPPLPRRDGRRPRRRGPRRPAPSPRRGPRAAARRAGGRRR